ncbi:class I SAM-dependent methyltransferase [Sulfurimonas sp.]
MLTNDYIEHYKKNKISPVRQVLNDFDKHIAIRIRLYQSLGLLKSSFKDKKVLEVGPGSGFNALVTMGLDLEKYLLIEANETAIVQMQELFKTYNVNLENIEIKNIFLEEYADDNIFDIVICENMLPWIQNNYELLQKIDKHISSDGVIVIGCSDEISSFFDLSRRLLANILLQRTKNDTFDEKIEILVSAFSSHLDTLKGFGRLKEDWCADNLLGNAVYNANLSVADVIDFFKDKYSFIGMSPSILCDETWHKEVEVSITRYNQVKIEKFMQIWHNFMHYKSFNARREQSDNLKLRKLCRTYFNMIKESEKIYSVNSRDGIIKVLKEISTNLQISNNDELSLISINELIDFLSKDEITIDSISNGFKSFHAAYGRGIQYLSMLKV